MGGGAIAVGLLVLLFAYVVLGLAFLAAFRVRKDSQDASEGGAGGFNDWVSNHPVAVVTVVILAHICMGLVVAILRRAG